MFKRHAFRIVVLEPFIGGIRIGEHLEVVGIANLLARIEHKNGRRGRAPPSPQTRARAKAALKLGPRFNWFSKMERMSARRLGSTGIAGRPWRSFKMTASVSPH